MEPAYLQKSDPAVFIREHCQVYDATLKKWLPFDLWDAQTASLQTIHERNLVAILKARQLGFSWLVIAYALWLCLYRPISTVLIFSKRDDEAAELLTRLKEMYARLPAHLQQPVAIDSGHTWQLRTGSRVRCFPTTGGRSYTATLVIVDECDYVENLERLLSAVKPTIDAGGKLILLSTSDKSKPQSAFKNIYRAARRGENDYGPIFHGWPARPGRDAAWYDAQRRDIFSRTGALDVLYQEYPATETEALAPNVLDKRIAAPWLEQCYQEMQGLRQLPRGAPSIPGLIVYRPPLPSQLYVVSGDPAEGNPTSDDSAMTVLDARTGEECAMLAGKLQPAVLAEYMNAVGVWYNHAPAMVERNNHGHAVIQWLLEHGRLPLLCGHDGRIGWLSSIKGKALLYEACADAFRCKETILHSFSTLCQLQSIEGNTLRAPEGEFDDEADAYALAIVGCTQAFLALSQEDVGDVVAVT